MQQQLWMWGRDMARGATLTAVVQGPSQAGDAVGRGRISTTWPAICREGPLAHFEPLTV